MPIATPVTPPLHHAVALPGRRKVILVAELGTGTAATAFKGILETDSFVRRPVAVKVFDLSSSDEPDQALLVLGRAVQRAAYVVHPNAVQTLEMALVDRSRALVITELVEGTTLERLLAGQARSGRRIPLDLALFVTTEIAEALSGGRMARTPEGVLAGIAHLDVALHQVLLSVHGEVKLSDFGLAPVARWGSGVRAVQGAAQRWATVAPEIVQGKGGDTRSDVFSLGILFREMLIGPRFGPDVSDADAMKHTRDGHVPPTFVELQLPEQVRNILARALDPDPSRRFAHATAMAYELRRVALSMGVGDGRMFLRTAVAEQTAAATVRPPAFQASDPDTTDEQLIDLIDLDDETPRLIADRQSGLILKADRSRKTRNNGTGD